MHLTEQSNIVKSTTAAYSKKYQLGLIDNFLNKYTNRYTRLWLAWSHDGGIIMGTCGRPVWSAPSPVPRCRRTGHGGLTAAVA